MVDVNPAGARQGEAVVEAPPGAREDAAVGAHADVPTIADQHTVTRVAAVTLDRTGSSDSQRPADAAGAITGRDYVKKIFQVPFGLPDIDRSLLRELVENLVEGTRLTAPQRHELTGRILRHLNFFSDEAGVNPREVKRLINAYTLQTKLLSLRLGKVDRDSILALQVMAFRLDWERIWRRFEADPDGFMAQFERSLRAAGRTGTVWVHGEPLPPRFVTYLTRGPARRLRSNKRLRAYLSSSQTSHSADPKVLNAQIGVDEIKRRVSRVDENTNREQLSVALHEKLDRLKSSIPSSPWGRQLVPLISQLEKDASTLAGATDGEPPPIDEWAQEFRARLARLDNELSDVRDRYSLRPS